MSKKPANNFSWSTITKTENWAWLLLFVFSLPAFEFHLGDTIDASIRLIQNLNFAQHPAALFNAHIPQGPLAFLQYPLPIGANLSLALFYYALIKLGILIFLRKQTIAPAQAMLLYAAIYLLISPRLLPFCLLVLLLFQAGEKPAFSFSGFVTLTLVLVLLYTRLSVGILGSALWFVTAFFTTVSKGFPFKESLQRLLLLVLLVLFFLTPYLFYSPLETVLSRFWALLHVNAAYSSQLLSLGFFVAVALLLILAFMLFGTISIGPLKKLALRPHQKGLAFVLVLYALLYFKSRPDAGTYYMVLNWVLIFFFALQTLPAKQLWKNTLLWLAVALLLGEGFLAQGSFKTTEIRVGAFFSQALKPEGYRQKFHHDNYKKAEILPVGASYLVLDERLNHWLLEDNNLLSSPSYLLSLAQNPFLDSLNAAYFTTSTAPHFVLSQDALEHSLATSPKSLAALKKQYQLVRQEGDILIYQNKSFN
tara:strand:+ start:1545 stop:2978 length:1434 start_codon:yes stop_codon:yes gene_type:complete